MPRVREEMIATLDFEDNLMKTIIRTLENENFHWRTLDGICKETGIAQQTTLSILEELEVEGIIIRIQKTKLQPKFLYTTRRHYKRHMKLTNRWLSVLTDKIR